MSHWPALPMIGLGSDKKENNFLSYVGILFYAKTWSQSLGEKQGSSRRSKWWSKGRGESGGGLGAGERAVQQGGVDDGGEVYSPASHAAQLHGGQVEQRRDFAFCSGQSPRRGDPTHWSFPKKHKNAMFVKISASDASWIVSRLASEPGLRAWARFPGSWSHPPFTLSLFQTCSLAFLRPRWLWGRFIHYCIALSINHW